MAAGEGFEPSQTESESGVLPLHKSSKWLIPERIYDYTHFFEKVNTFFQFFKFFIKIF